MDCNDMLIARCVLEVRRADCDTNWPHGLVGLTPALTGGPLRFATWTAPLPGAVVITARDASLEHQTPITTG